MNDISLFNQSALLLTITLLLVFSSSSVQGYYPQSQKDLKSAEEAILREDYKTAHKLLLPLGEMGIASAQNYLGLMYANGQGVIQDDKEAIKWYRLAVEQWFADAQYNLGWMYEKGQGVIQNDKEAVKWYRLAAGQEDAYAQSKLGWIYFFGKRVPQDFEEAFKWFQLAAEQGHAEARHKLILMYQNGQGILQADKDKAKRDQLDAEQGYATAQFNLGVRYSKGKGVLRDYKEAEKWYRLAAEQGLGSAQINLGNMYFKGKGVLQDKQEAAKWYRLAAEQGDASVQYFLGLLYEKGQGVIQNDKEAVKWYRLAAEQEHAKAQNRLGLMYKHGWGVPQDFALALMWFNLSGTNGEESGITHRKILGRWVTPQQSIKAREMAENWRPKNSRMAIKQVELSEDGKKTIEKTVSVQKQALNLISKKKTQTASNSQVCKESDRKFAAEYHNNYYDPEEAYAFGLKIQNAVKDRNLKKLFSFVVDGELGAGPRRQYVEGKTFSEIFPDEWRKQILSSKPKCSPLGWKPFMLANGTIWYNKFKNDNKDEGRARCVGDKRNPSLCHWSIITIHGAMEEKFEKKDLPVGWKVSGEHIPPQCFVKEWYSSDNYEEFDKQYQIENFDDFRKNPGKYLGKEINLTSINPSWGGEKITLVAFLDQCLVGSVLDGRIVEKNKVKVDINKDSIKSKSCSSDGTACSDYAYNLIASIPLNHCRELAPNLSGECRSSYLVAIGDYGGGSMGWDYSYNIYGLFELKDKRKVVVPLKNFNNMNIAKNYVESIIER